MVRPRKCRCVTGEPNAIYFKPRGISLCELQEAVLEIDEFEALRLADMESLYHTEAAEQMKVSRATFGRILRSARLKVADALVRGKALRIMSSPDGGKGGPK